MIPIRWLMTAALGTLGAGALPLCAEEKPEVQGEVRLPLQAWQQKFLEGEKARPVETPAPPPAPSLRSVKYRVSERDGRLVLEVPFRVSRFAAGWSTVPVLAGDFVLEDTEPAAVRLLAQQGWICHVEQAAGESAGSARFVATGDGTDTVQLETAKSPAAYLEVGTLAAGHGLVVSLDGRERALAAGSSLPLSGEGVKLGLKILRGEEATEALKPPQPSVWSWQHRVLVLPGESEMEYRISAHASASDGSGTEAVLRLPAEARQVTAKGEDLADSAVRRANDGTPQLQLRWKSRGVLERDVTISYTLPQRPLDKQWTLTAPMPDQGKAGVRYMIAQSDSHAYQAEKLEGPLLAESCPTSLRDSLRGKSYFMAEGTGPVTLGVRELPRVAIADAVVEEADWSLRVEADGSQLLEGQWKVAHTTPLRLPLRVPAGMQLLRCTVNGKPLEPIDKGNGALEVSLSDGGSTPTVFACSFTIRGKALEAVEGTLALSLPQTPLFIRTLGWRVQLPGTYQAETYGNLTREANPANESASLIRLRKNLCRDEQPETTIFYQRRDLSL